MNPLTNIKNLQKLNERELELGVIGKKSWHDEYKDSAWVFTGGLPFDLTEGDILCVFSQYGEIVNINLVRDGKTGKSKGFAFICFENQKSTVLTVDNLNGIKILGRTIRVDHVKDYKMPKERGDEDDITVKLRQEGCAPRIESSAEEEAVTQDQEREKKEKKKKASKKKLKKEKKKKKKKKKKNSSSSSSSSSSGEEESSGVEDQKSNLQLIPKTEIKEEKEDKGYDSAWRGKHNSTKSDRNYRSRAESSIRQVKEEAPENGFERLRDGKDGQRKSHSSPRRRYQEDERNFGSGDDRLGSRDDCERIRERESSFHRNRSPRDDRRQKDDIYEKNGSRRNRHEEERRRKRSRSTDVDYGDKERSRDGNDRKGYSDSGKNGSRIASSTSRESHREGDRDRRRERSRSRDRDGSRSKRRRSRSRS